LDGNESTIQHNSYYTTLVMNTTLQIILSNKKGFCHVYIFGSWFLLKIMILALMSPNHQYCNGIIDRLTWWPKRCLKKKVLTFDIVRCEEIESHNHNYCICMCHIMFTKTEIYIICSHIISWVVYIYNHIIQTWASAITHLYLSKVCAQLWVLFF
jgi:hypothetical protein